MVLLTPSPLLSLDDAFVSPLMHPHHVLLAAVFSLSKKVVIGKSRWLGLLSLQKTNHIILSVTFGITYLYLYMFYLA